MDDCKVNCNFFKGSITNRKAFFPSSVTGPPQFEKMQNKKNVSTLSRNVTKEQIRLAKERALLKGLCPYSLPHPAGIGVKLSKELFITTPLLQDWIAHCFKAFKSGLARELPPLEACGDDKFDLIAQVNNSVGYGCKQYT
jgi:hypothetical protein